MMPKTGGAIIMISAFTGRAVGFGRFMTDEELRQVNASRSGQDYISSDAATKLYGSAKKGELKTTPFICFLEVGINNEGYWNASYMAIQVEDIIDSLKVLYPEFEYKLLFDHSCSHDHKRDGGLDAKAMNVSHGGTASKMHRTKIEAVGSFLPSIGVVGEEQEMDWTALELLGPGNPGPFYLTDVDKIRLRTDQSKPPAEKGAKDLK
jgi:hypothetical protein